MSQTQSVDFEVRDKHGNPIGTINLFAEVLLIADKVYVWRNATQCFYETTFNVIKSVDKLMSS